MADLDVHLSRLYLTDTVVTRREAHFVDHGPYRYVRNPMYSGILISAPASAFLLERGWCPLAATAMFWMLARRTRIEETYLIARFGDQYRSYMNRVGRFFPHFTRAQSDSVCTTSRPSLLPR